MAKSKGNKDKKPNKKKSGAYSVLMNVVLVLVATVAIMLASIGAAGANMLEKGVFPNGTDVDGVNIGGLSYDDARERVEEAKNSGMDDIFFELDCDGTLLSLNAQDLGVSYDIDGNLGKLGASVGSNSNILLLGIKQILIPEPGQSASIPLSYDEKTIREALEQKLNSLNKQAKNAQAQFNKETATFVYEDEQIGRSPDIDATLEEVLKELANNGEGIIKVKFTTIEPEITRDMLFENTVLVSECTTVLTKNDNRNINIELMCKAVDGFMLNPGETLSINELVGQRTADKGFKQAPAIVDGSFMEDLGGGICQLSGTLYNAALLADMEIVERKRHSYPSTYLPVGLDSTLNWDNKDLKIKNNSEYPIYISAKMDLEQMLLTVRLYGQPMPEGKSIEIVPEVLREIKPGGQKIEFTTTLPSGTRKTTQAAQIGYEVKVYREYYFNGELMDRALISHDTYNSREATVLVGTSDENKEEATASGNPFTN